MELLSIIPKKSVAKKQIMQAKRGTQYCQSFFEIFSSIPRKICQQSNRTWWICSIEKLIGVIFNYVIKLKDLPIQNFINKKRLKPKVNKAIIDITEHWFKKVTKCQ